MRSSAHGRDCMIICAICGTRGHCVSKEVDARGICVTPNRCCENVQSNEQFAKLRSLPSTWLHLVESRKRWLVDLREMAGIRFESTLEYCLGFHQNNVLLKLESRHRNVAGYDGRLKHDNFWYHHPRKRAVIYTDHDATTLA